MQFRSAVKVNVCFSCVNSVLSGPAGVPIERHSSYHADLKKLIGHVSYQRLVLGFLFTSLAFQVRVFAQADHGSSVVLHTVYSRREYSPVLYQLNVKLFKIVSSYINYITSKLNSRTGYTLMSNTESNATKVRTPFITAIQIF